MISNILTATDGSEHAEKALDLATDLAAKYGAKLAIMHVTTRDPLPEALRHAAEIEHLASSPPPDYSIPLAAAPQGNETVRSRRQEDLQVRAHFARNLLNQAEQQAAKKGVREISQIMDEGDPAKRILAAAETGKFDMIVMGSRGLGDLKGLLVGSVSHKVSHLARCTCVCVK